MSWKCWALLASVAILLMGVAWFMQSRQSAWLIKEKELVEDSARWQRLAATHGSSAAEAETRANDADREAAAAIAELDAWKKRKRPKPITLVECETQLNEFDAGLMIAERVVAYTRIANSHLRDTIEEQRGQIKSLGNALQAERKRGDGWKRYSRRARVKQAFFGIGMGVGGGLAGYGVGVATR